VILPALIAGKQAMNPEHEASGAIQAAYQFNSLAKLQVVGKANCNQNVYLRFSRT
jgi:hypothetical protein